jgi:hypothetical protein
LARTAGVVSTHGAQGRHYATVAVQALFALGQPGWVPCDDAFTHFVKRNGDLKWTVLGELGRIPDDPTLRAVAQFVGRQRLSTGQAMAVIRRIRIGDDRSHPD